MTHDLELEALKLALEDNAIGLISYIKAAQPSKTVQRAVFWGNRGSFKYETAGPRRGRFTDFEGGSKTGDLLQLIMNEFTGSSFVDAINWAKNWLGWPSDGVPDTSQRIIDRLQERAKEAAKAQAKAEDDKKTKIKQAREIWDRSVHPAGTLAAIYLTKTRAVPLETYPSCIRFDPVKEAVVFALTLEDDTVQAIQSVYLDSEGRKTQRGWHKLEKESTGPQTGALVRLPGPQDGPYCIAEGPETALSVWAATGYETVATVGTVTKADTPEGRLVVLVRDDDPKDHPSQNAINNWQKELTEQGVQFVDAWPWDVRRGDKSDFNDLLQVSGPESVRARIALAVEPQKVIRTLSLSVDSARELTSQRVHDWVEQARSWWKSPDPSPPPVFGLGVPLGVGKTEAALRAANRMLLGRAKNSLQRSIVMATPQHKLNSEIASRFKHIVWSNPNDNDFRVEIWRGREAHLPGGVDDERMCGDWETVREAQSLYADIDKEVCGACPLALNCAYLAQKDLNADLWLVSHQMLFHSELPRAVHKLGIMALMVDESPWQAGLVGVEGRGIQVPLDWLDRNYLPLPAGDGPRGGARLSDIRSLMQKAVNDNKREGYITRTMLESVGFDKETGAIAENLEWMRKEVDGNWKDRINNKSLTPMTKMWAAVNHLMNNVSLDTSGRLYITRDKETGTWVIEVTGRKEVSEYFNVPTLLTDASLKKELVEPYWPQIEVAGSITVSTPNMRVVQVIDKAFSKQMLEPKKPSKKILELINKEELEKTNKTKAKKRLKIATLVDKVERHRPGKTVVISNKGIVQALPLQPHIPTMWFNATAGHDEHRDARTLFVIGRTKPGVRAVERMAGALTGAAPNQADGDYPREEVFRQKAVPGGFVPVVTTAERHPDPIAELIRERICEGEVMQAVGRVRGVNRAADDPVLVVVLTDVILPIPADEYLTSAILDSPDLQDQMLTIGGIAFDDGAAAALAYPQMGNTASITKALQRSANQSKSIWTKWYRSISYRNVQMLNDGLVVVRYRRAGPSYRNATATVDLARYPDPRAAVEALLGPLAFFEVMLEEGQDGPAGVIPFPVALKGPPDVLRASQGPLPALSPQPALIGLSPPSGSPLEPRETDTIIDLSGIRLALTERNLSIAKAAQSFGISQPHLINMLQGRRRITPEVEANIVALLKSAEPVQRRLL